MLQDIKQDISCKITNLRKIDGLKKHDDIWELQQLIASYYHTLSVLDTKADIDMKKLNNVIKPLEKKFIYFTNLTL